jgi:uncharacterized membrane protein YfcA
MTISLPMAAYHEPMAMLTLTFALAALCGGLGALLGMGGGVFLIPALTLLLHVPMKTAIGASALSVIASSAMAGALSASSQMTHVRLALILEIATTLGVLTGGLTAVWMSPRHLMIVFALVTLLMAGIMALQRGRETAHCPTGLLDTTFADPLSGERVHYGLRRLNWGLLGGFASGNISGLLGIGGGVVKVPLMHLVMGVPLKAAIATSNFMVGITAAGSAMIYYQAGFIRPDVAAPAALGVLLGARLSTAWGHKAHQAVLRRLLLIVLVVIASQMLLRALQP